MFAKSKKVVTFAARFDKKNGKFIDIIKFIDIMRER